MATHTTFVSITARQPMSYNAMLVKNDFYTFIVYGTYKDNHFDFIEHSWHHTVCFIAMQTLDAALPIFSGTIQ